MCRGTSGNSARGFFFGAAIRSATSVTPDRQKDSSELGRNPDHLNAPCPEPSDRCPLEPAGAALPGRPSRSEEHTSELQSLMRTSYAVFCLKKKTKNKQNTK